LIQKVRKKINPEISGFEFYVGPNSILNFFLRSDNNNHPKDRFHAHEKMQRKPSRRSCVKISGCLSRGTRASFRNFSNKEDEGRFIFKALELFVTFWGNAKK
jgi:hypothetical protein